MMDSLPSPYRAVVIGASGGIGGAMAARLADDPACEAVHAFARSGAVRAHDRIVPGRIDITDEESVSEAARTVAAAGPPALVVVATGFLHGPDAGPEKSWSQIAPEALALSFAVNATGPALVAKHFLPVLPRGERAIFACLSARVGSISDNRVGGWYGYRASKAALNQILRCLAIEGGRKRKGLVVAGLQPGTVRTALSEPFRTNVPEERLFEPDEAAENLLRVLNGLGPEQSGGLFDWQGEPFAP